MNDELQHKIELGRHMLALHRIQHEEMYEDGIVDKDAEHKRLEEELDRNIKLCGFKSVEEFFEYNEALKAYQANDTEGYEYQMAYIAEHFNG